MKKYIYGCHRHYNIVHDEFSWTMSRVSQNDNFYVGRLPESGNGSWTDWFCECFDDEKSAKAFVKRQNSRNV